MTLRLPSALLALAGLTACADLQSLLPPRHDAPRGLETAPSSSSATTGEPNPYPATVPGSERDDAEYHNGYEIGQRDQSLGLPRDHSRGYRRFGKGKEVDFRAGYYDGYAGVPERR